MNESVRLDRSRSGPLRPPHAVRLALAFAAALFVLLTAAAATGHAYTDTSNMTDAAFFDKLDLDAPGLATVKTHVQNGDYAAAKASLLAYYRSRTSPVHFDVGTTPVTSPMSSTADELADYTFKFTDGQVRDFNGNIDWAYHWNPGDPTQFGGPHYYIMDFMMNAILAPSYNALPAADPRRTQYADTWMKFTLEYVADEGNSLAFGTDNNQLDMAKRVANWISAYTVFKNDAVVDANGHTAFLKHMWQMADMLYDGIEGTSGNNWYMSLAWSIYSAGVYFPEFKDAENWRMRGEGATYKYMRKNVKGDGMNVEPTENYHLYSLSLANRLQKLGAMNGYSVLGDLQEVLERGGEALMDLTLPNFEVPMIGDTSDKSLGTGSVLNDYATYYGRTDFQYVGTKGAQGTVPSNLSVLYPNSFAVMRSGWGANDAYMMIENQDTDYTGSHNHPDDLSLMMYALGKRLIVDPGVNNYLDIPSSNWLRKTTKAHNTVEPNGNTQSNLDRRHIKWYSNGGFDFYHGQHSDYAPIVHERKIFFAKPDFWIVSDRMTGSSIANAYKQYWHFMPTSVTLDGATKRASTSFAGEANVKIVPADPGSTTATVHTDGYYSDAAGVVQSGVSYLSYGKTATGSATFDTVLFPQAPGQNRNPTVARLATGAASTVATALKIEHDAGNGGNVSYYYLSHETAPATRSFDAFTTDGEVAYVEKTPAGALRSASIARGTSLKDGTTSLIAATATVHHLSVRYDGPTLELYSSDVLAPTVTIYAPGVTAVKLNGSAIAFAPSGGFVTVGGQSSPSAGTPVLNDSFDVAGLTSETRDFENGSAAGLEPKAGTWSVDTQGTSKVYRQSASSQTSAAAVTVSKWTDALVEAKVTTLASNGSYNGVGLYARYQDPANNYHFQYYTNGGSPQLVITKNFNGTSTNLASVPYTMSHNTTYTLKAIASGNVLKFYVNNVLQLTAYDTDILIGRAGLGTHRRDAYFDDMKVTEIVDGDRWDIGKGHFLINNFELYSDSLNETSSEIRTRSQNDWSDTIGEAKVKVVAWGTAPGRAGIVARSLGGNDGYRFVAYNDGSARKLRIEKVVDGQAAEAAPVVLAEKPYTFNAGTSYTFRAVADGGMLKFYVNGTEELAAYDTLLSKGGFGLHASKAQIRFDDVSVQLIP
ncbi:heparinase II/III family protein [Paenibacillus flagellatus]|uniref:Uncharacterized protein n=1 Tax=Paenibacillus flagellatus TaxID=2211139 RepID=A0A2V5K3J6_9BACL|nr:heparinase II/III family protein [Paenibacillus flagellatus]PYI53829.1 hypothetical protein DLM86_14830 [Paenibacillus flagellatus]